MTSRFMTDAEREEIAAIEARCKARFQAAWENEFVFRASGIEARQRTDPEEGLDPKGESPTGKAGDAQ